MLSFDWRKRHPSKEAADRDVAQLEGRFRQEVDYLATRIADAQAQALRSALEPFRTPETQIASLGQVTFGVSSAVKKFSMAIPFPARSLTIENHSQGTLEVFADEAMINSRAQINTGKAATILWAPSERALYIRTTGGSGGTDAAPFASIHACSVALPLTVSSL